MNSQDRSKLKTTFNVNKSNGENYFWFTRRCKSRSSEKSPREKKKIKIFWRIDSETSKTDVKYKFGCRTLVTFEKRTDNSLSIRETLVSTFIWHSFQLLDAFQFARTLLGLFVHVIKIKRRLEEENSRSISFLGTFSKKIRKGFNTFVD